VPLSEKILLGVVLVAFGLPCVAGFLSMVSLYWRIRSRFPDEWSRTVLRLRAQVGGVRESWAVAQEILGGGAPELSRDKTSRTLARLLVICTYWAVFGVWVALGAGWLSSKR